MQLSSTVTRLDLMLKGWSVAPIGRKSDVHIYPAWQDHDLISRNCFCVPDIELLENGWQIMVIHNAVTEC